MAGIYRDSSGREVYTVDVDPNQVNAAVNSAVGGAVNTAVTTAVGGLAIPTPATAMPPGVADSSSTGTQTSIYALANHTHASKARKQRVLGVATATYTWTYPTPFTAGSVPIVQAIVEDPANSASDNYNVQVVGVPSATQATVRIIRQSTGLLSLLTGALSLNPTAGTVNLHLIALEP